MKKPIIGVTPNHMEDKLLMSPAIMESIINAGGIPVIIPFGLGENEAKQLDGLFDGYVFTGGPDVNPALYGEEKHPKCGDIIDVRDKTDFLFIDIAYKSKKPVLGICRGCQVMNTYLGGTLYQDYPSMVSDKISHTDGPFPAMAKHNMNIFENTPFADLFKTDKIICNSYHHQGVKTLAPSLTAMAEDDEGLTEAFYAKDRDFFVGVQWHPERLFDGDIWSPVLWNKLIEESAK